MKSVNMNHQPCKENHSDFGLKLKIPPPLYMLLFAGVMWLMNSLLPLATLFSVPWNKLGLLIMALSFIPAAAAFRQFFRHKTTADPRYPAKASTLVMTGIYGFSRNPMYLGLLLILTAWAIYLGSLIAMLFPLMFIWVITEQQIKPEELVLQKIFGNEYLCYKQKVKRWL